MSSFKRLVDIARSEVGALRNKVSEKAFGGRRLDEFSDDELVAEIEKRRLQKQLKDEQDAQRVADEARRGGPDPAAAAPSTGPRAAEPRAARPSPRASTGKIVSKAIEQYYANLEVEVGSDLETVKRAYRRLMRRYHPDKHAGDPEKYRNATVLAQSLTRAYMELKKHLEGGGTA